MGSFFCVRCSFYDGGKQEMRYRLFRGKNGLYCVAVHDLMNWMTFRFKTAETRANFVLELEFCCELNENN